jgi:prolipoprotein diacylglyceryl transferase
VDAAANLSRVIALSIPSPGDPFLIKAGGFQVRWYGLLLAAGVLLAGWIARREFRRRGFDPELAYSIAVWTVPLGLVGARLYHVVTDWGAFQHHLVDMFKIWKGGLGIYGAILGGMLGTWIGCRRVKLAFWAVADCIAPGLILAQALGRWGNYFNQELYGRPSDLPWAVKIDHPQLPYHEGQTFHPTFLYESLASLVVFGILIWFIRRYWRDVPRGTVFALYATLYSFERIWVETLRIDPAHRYLGQRLNVWVASAVTIVAGILFGALFRRRRPAAPAPTATPAAAGPPHTPTARPDAAIAARLRSKRRRRH